MALSLLHAFISFDACYLLADVWLCLVRVLLWMDLSFRRLLTLHVCTLLLLVLDFNGINCYRNSYRSSSSYFSP